VEIANLLLRAPTWAEVSADLSALGRGNLIVSLPELLAMTGKKPANGEVSLITWTGALP